MVRRAKARGAGSKGGSRGRTPAPLKRPVPSPKRKRAKARSKPASHAPRKQRKRVKRPAALQGKLKKATRPARPSSRALPIAAQVRLRESVALLRKHLTGFSGADGYDLRNMDRWPVKKIRAIHARAAKLHELLLTPHDLVKATTKKGRKNLRQFTGQNIRGAKHFVVHKPADNFRVRLRDGNVEIEGKFKGRVITRSQFFLFPRRPRYPKELVAMTRRMLKEMPPGFYTVITAAHGDTGEPFDRDQIINRLNEYLAAYEVDAAGKPTGFSEALIGYRFMSTTLRGAVVQRQKVDARRERQREYNKKKRAKTIQRAKKHAGYKVYLLTVHWIGMDGKPRRTETPSEHRTRALAEKRAGRIIAMLRQEVRASARYEIAEEVRYK